MIKRMLSLCLCFLFAFSLISSPLFSQRIYAQGSSESNGSDWTIPGSIVVMFKKGITYELMYDTLFQTLVSAYPKESLEEINSRIDCRIGYRTQTIQVNNDDTALIIQNLKANSYIECVEYNYTVEFSDDAFIDFNDHQGRDLFPQDDYDPGDSGVSPLGQWHLGEIGVSDAWNASFVGNNSSIVVVVDSGYTYHSQLSSVVNTALAYNEYDDNTNVTDDMGHGTFIAGLIGAALDGIGTNGICQNVTIVPIKVTYYDPVEEKHKGDYSAIVRSVERAENIAASVVNISFTLAGTVNSLKSAITSFGKLVTFSAGNEGELLENDDKNYAKANDEPLWVIVGSSDVSHQCSDSSDYSADYVDLFAPGKDLISTNNTNGYRKWSGTSFSAPIVAAAIAMISSHATHLTPSQIKSYLINYTTVPSGTNPFSGMCVAEGYLNLDSIITAIYNEYRGAYSLGDGNGDGYITAADYLKARQIALGQYNPTLQESTALDVNSDGDVDLIDYTIIRRYVLMTYYLAP